MESGADVSGEAWVAYESPLGELTLVGGAGGLRRVFFPGHASGLNEADRSEEALADAVRQLDEYFAGEREGFELDLDLRGDGFQLAVWDQLLQIPYGETVSYGEIAERIGRPGEARDVGSAVARTPVPIIVPCHRVVAGDGALTGYLGGLERKQALLDLESSQLRIL
jgi:methylated-DNA-[protein]-cysteine S-methyltransferase